MTSIIWQFKTMLSKLQVPFSHVKLKFLTKWIVRRYSSAIIAGPAKGKAKCECSDPTDSSYCNVALIGADSKLGELTAYLLKQNPLISCLHLQGGAAIDGLKTDLSHMDTRCRVVAHSGTDNYRNAMKTADIIVLFGMGGFSKQTSIGDRVMTEGSRICKVAEKCTQYARRAIILVCATPVSVMTPLVTDIFRKTLWYHPAKIFGFPGPISVVVNSEVAQHQTFDPHIVDVPVTGGPDLESMVPVFSKAVPCPVERESSVVFAARLRGIEPNDFPKNAQPADAFINIPYPEAVALNRLISAIAYGIHGDEQAVGYAHVRTNIVKTCRFMVSQVKFGPEGVVHNYGIPKLSILEQDLLERAVAMLSFKEQMAAEYLEYYLSKRRDILPRFKQQEVDEYIEKKKSLLTC